MTVFHIAIEALFLLTGAIALQSILHSLFKGN